MRILLVNDRVGDYVAAMALALESGGLQVTTVQSYSRAERLLSEREFGGIMVEAVAGDGRDLELCRMAAERGIGKIALNRIDTGEVPSGQEGWLRYAGFGTAKRQKLIKYFGP